MTKQKRQLTEKQLNLVKKIRNDGLYNGFIQVVRGISHGNMPQNIDSMLIHILENAQPKCIPRNVLNRLSDQFGGQWIKLVATDGIGIILYKDTPVMFVSVTGIKLHSVNRKKKTLVPENDMSRGEEIKTSNGRTIKGSIMSGILKNNLSKGEFAIPDAV